MALLVGSVLPTKCSKLRDDLVAAGVAEALAKAQAADDRVDANDYENRWDQIMKENELATSESQLR
jgi:hypothetical protein